METSQPSEYKECWFDVYCPWCVHEKIDEHEEPCNECLTETVNLYSHKPVKFEGNEKYEREDGTAKPGKAPNKRSNRG